MGGKLVKAAAEHAEDIALAVGVIAVSVAFGVRIGWWAGLLAFGVCLIGYGVAIARGGA